MTLVGSGPCLKNPNRPIAFNIVQCRILSNNLARWRALARLVARRRQHVRALFIRILPVLLRAIIKPVQVSVDQILIYAGERSLE